MKYLVTGINGVVGGNIFRKLSENPSYQVWGISGSRYKYEQYLSPEKRKQIFCLDLRSDETLSTLLPAEFDVIIHAAAVTPNSKRDTNAFNNNSQIAVTLSKYINTIKCSQFFFVSSGSVYAPEQGSCSETSETVTNNDYGMSMLEAETVFLRELESVVILRLFYPYSFDKLTNDNNLISRLRQRIKNGETIQVSPTADNSYVNPLFFDDLLMVIDKLYEKGIACDIYNVAAPLKISFVELLKKIAAIEKKELFVSTNDTLSNPLLADVTKLHGIIDGSEFTSFDEGLKLLYRK